jgi:hypothetical protein
MWKSRGSLSAPPTWINPKYSVDSCGKRNPFKDQSEIDKVINALHKAGLK